MVNCLNVCAIVLAFLGIGFLIVSVATDYWRSFTFTLFYKTTRSEGLFRQCLSANSQTSCSKLMKEISDYPGNFSLILLNLSKPFWQILLNIFTKFITEDKNPQDYVCIIIRGTYIDR